MIGMAGRSPRASCAHRADRLRLRALHVVQDAREPARQVGRGDARGHADATPEASREQEAAKKKAKIYTVKSGDTPSGIAEKTGISLETLQSSTPNSTRRRCAGPSVRLSE
jgi:LysM repeat protein